ncbi:hypothetical protein AA313_de0206974 [Arthrobotrys entomopaga]|nr:hypothetical protein AA313_de0206974 [Arthrobotrys entomopaga]
MTSSAKYDFWGFFFAFASDSNGDSCGSPTIGTPINAKKKISRKSSFMLIIVNLSNTLSAASKLLKNLSALKTRGEFRALESSPSFIWNFINSTAALGMASKSSGGPISWNSPSLSSAL